MNHEKLNVTIQQWYDAIGEEVIAAEGYGQASLVPGNSGFLVIFSDMALERPNGLADEIECENAMFSGSQDIMDAVNYFLSKLPTSERERVLSGWKSHQAKRGKLNTKNQIGTPTRQGQRHKNENH